MSPRGTIREFDPGWIPGPLNFTATYLAEPRRTLSETAARLARDVAIAFCRR